MKELKVYGLDDSDIIEESIDQPHIQLSLYDLNQIVGFKSVKETNSREELERILFECGMDVTKTYILRKCLHRPRSSNLPYDGFRFEGTERLDKPYLMSGLASLEAKLFTKDIELRKELNRLDPNKMYKRSFEDDAKVHIDTFRDDEVYQLEGVDAIVAVESAGEDCI